MAFASMRRMSARLLAFGALAIVAPLASCSSDDGEEDEDRFVVRSTGHALAAGNAEIVGDGDWLAYLVSEAGQGASGTDYNGDGDTNDGIVARVDTDNPGSGANTLEVAGERLAFARRTLFITVDEARDSRDWNGDADMNDDVLLYVTPSAAAPVYYDDIASTDELVTIGGTVVYTSPVAPAFEFESNLRIAVVAAAGAAPAAPETVLTETDVNMDGISFELRGADGDIVFLEADEAVDGDLNGDGDSNDDGIFGVLDAGEAMPMAFNVGRAIQPGSRATAAPVTGGGEWLVAFLVDEDAGGASLNDPSDFSPTWAAPNCADADTDTDDAVLHWFQVTDLAMNTPAVNTGLIGHADGTAYALRSGFVGVVSPEAEQGSGTCNWNGDGDENDDIFRWVSASNPAMAPLPVTTSSRLIAIDKDVPGGSGGVVRLTDTWVILVDEAADGRDYDTEPGTDRTLVLAHNPSNGGQAWVATHGQSAPRAVGVTWMAEDEESSSQFFAAFAEEPQSIVGSGDINGDGDSSDSLPTIPEIVSGAQLQFPGIPVATSRTNAGIIVEQGVGYHRLSEADEGSTDFNGDGDANDVVLQRFSLSNAFPRTVMGTASSIQRSVVDFGSGAPEFGAFVTEEFQDGVDLNGDNDTSDFVVRYFSIDG